MEEVTNGKRWQRDRDRDVCYDRHKKDIKKTEMTHGLIWQRNRDRDVCYDRHKKDNKQGQIHGNPVAAGLAEAVRIPLGIQKCDGPTDLPTCLPTDRHGKV